MTDQSAAALQIRAKRKPFFLAVGYRKPHLPFVAPRRYSSAIDPERLPLAEESGLPSVRADSRPGGRR